MSHANLDDREIVQRGKAIYENQIRPKVETQENIGKIISIDIETCDYEIDSDLLVNLPVKIVIIQIVSWEQNHPMLTLDQLISEETALPDTAKAILLDKILESMKEQIDRDVLNEGVQKAQDRIAEIDSSTVQSIPGDVGLAQVRQLLGK